VKRWCCDNKILGKYDFIIREIPIRWLRLGWKDVLQQSIGIILETLFILIESDMIHEKLLYSFLYILEEA